MKILRTLKIFDKDFLVTKVFTKIPNLLNLILLVDRSFYIIRRSIGQTKVSVDTGKELT